MIERVGEVLVQILISLDQLAQVLVVGAFYAAGLAPLPPSADETISSYVGRGQQRGARWAGPVAWAIDGLFVLLGAAPGHCRRNVETACTGRAPTA
ncbi:hypothetical protein [Sphingomonas jinjuensis]|uniref:hypothetical protein n=1 Tax=Sphingomonas jinjuensis TaxID=535907 RepID=UPI0031B5BE32